MVGFAAEVKSSILSGTLLSDIGRISSNYKSAIASVPLNGPPPTNTYKNNTVKNATIVGYAIFDSWTLIDSNSADNVPSSLLGGFLYDSLCGYYVYCDYCTISNNYAANSSAGFYLDVYNALVTGNTSEYNSWFGYLVEMYGDTTLSLNKAKFNGGSERWTGGFEIWSSSSNGNTITGNTATKNGNGMSICAINYELVSGNTVTDNRIQGLSLMCYGVVDLVSNTVTDNDGEGIANQGGNIGVMTGNIALTNRTDICNDGGMMPDPPVGNTYNTYNPVECVLGSTP
jgi:parallel beta-helix repeat protein